MSQAELKQGQMSLLRQLLGALEQHDLASLAPLLERWNQLNYCQASNPSLNWTITRLQLHSEFDMSWMIETLQFELEQLEYDLAIARQQEMDA